MARLKTVMLVTLLAITSIFVMATVAELYDEDVRQDCVGPACVIGYAYQKTWTKVWYDTSARKIIGHSGNADIRSGGAYVFSIVAQAHPYIADCIGDPWSSYQWARIDYDVVDWHVLTTYAPATRWTTVSSVWVSC